MNKSVMGIAVAAIILAAAGSYFLIIAPAQAPPKPEKANLVLGVSFATTRSYNLVAQVGIQRGFFEKYGLSVEHVKFTGASELAKAKGAGQIDVSIESSLGYYEAFVRGIKYQIIGGVNDFDNFAVFTRADLPIKSFQDLQGKKVCVTDLAGTTYALTVAAMQKTGVKVELVGCGPTARGVAAMESGSVQGAVHTTESARPYTDKGFYKPPILLMNDVLPKPWQEVIITASPDMISKFPGTLKAFMRGVSDSVKWIRDNPQEATQLIADHYKTSIQVESDNVKELQPGWTPDLKPKPQAIKNAIDLLKTTEILKGAIPPVEEFYTDKFVP